MSGSHSTIDRVRDVSDDTLEDVVDSAGSVTKNAVLLIKPRINMKSINHDRYFVPGLARGLEVLRLFSSERRILSITDVAKELGISRSSAFRLMYTLEYLGFLQKTEEGKKYRLGLKVLSLGFAYLGSLDLIDAARPALEALRDELGVSTHVVVRDGIEVVYVARYAARGHITSNVQVGKRLPAHATVLGQVLLSGLTDQEIAALYRGRKLKSHTDRTPTTIDALLKRAHAARQHGYLTSWGYFEKSLASIAAAIHDDSGATIAAMNITCPIDQFKRDDFESRIAQRVLETAGDISEILGYRK